MARSWSRLGPARVPTVLGVLAAGVLLTALVVTGRSQHLAPGRPPTRPVAPATADTAPISLGTNWACPLLAPVPAFADHYSYPPGHPAAPPRSVRPAVCFPSAAQASAAGYPPAPPPAGTLEVGGVYLTPTGARLQRRCRQAADATGLAVPCPTLLPAMAPHALPPDPCDQRFGCSGEGGFLFEQDGFEVPPDYVVPAGQPSGRLVVAAAGRADDPLVTCEGRGRVVAAVTPHGRAGQLIDCGEAGVHRDSVLVRWRERGAVMVVSVLGQARVQERLALTVAERTRVIRPSRRDGEGR